MSVAALVLALWPVVADAPWEDGVTEPELREIIQTEHEASSKASKEEKEAEKVAKCESLREITQYAGEVSDKGFPDHMFAVWFEAIIENNCWSSK